MGQVHPATKEDHYFHNEVSSAAIPNGVVFKNEVYNKIAVEIFGSVANSARKVNFYRKSRSGALKPIIGFRTSDLASATSTTGTGEEWEFSVVPGREYIMELESMTGGTVTVVGTGVAM